MKEDLYRPQRNWGARVLEYRSKGMRVVFLENELLRVGVLVDKGTDVFEFNYKPRDMDFVWLSAGGVRNPTSYLSTSPDPLATFLDYYPGGWQEIFPNGGAPSSYFGAQFGQHGEVSNLPWDYEIVEDDEGAVAVRFSVRTQKTPFLLEKVLRLHSGESRLYIEETLANESEVPLRAMWGHHITFGRPFLEEGCRISLPDGVTVIPHDEPIHPEGRRVNGGKNYAWPWAEGGEGEEVNLSVLPERGTLSEMLYLTDLSEGWYEIENLEKGLSLRMTWDAGQMPYLWFWQEFGASDFYPWYSRHYNIGLEPFSSFPTSGIQEAIENGTALSLAPRERRRFSLHTEVFEVGQTREGGGGRGWRNSPER
jgi:galactose mutarotase-like enzyme